MNKFGYCPFFSYCPHKGDICHSLLPYEKCWHYNTFINKMDKLYNMKPEDFLEYIGVIKNE